MGLFRATVRLDFPVGSGGGTNTWHLRTLSSGGTTTEVAALMGKVRDFYDALKSHVGTDYVASWDGLVAQVAVPDPALLEQATPWSVAGTGTATSYGPAPAMGCVTWRSSLATKRGRGRTFHGPLRATSFEGNGTLSSGYVTALRGAAQALVSASLVDTNGAIVVFSAADNIGRDIVASSVTDQAAVLRSRR